MMKKMLRVTSYICAVLLLVGTLSACGGASAQNPAQPPASATAAQSETVQADTPAAATPAPTDTPAAQSDTAAAAATEAQATAAGDSTSVCPPPDLSGKTLNIISNDTWVSGITLASILPRFKQVEDRTGVTLKWDVLPGGDDYDTLLQTRLAADDRPDIIMLVPDAVRLSKFINDGMLADITKYYADLPNISNFYQVSNPELRKSFTYTDGGIYTLPNSTWRLLEEQQKWLGYTGDNAIWYRGDIAAQLGFTDMPTTLDEVHKMYQAVKAAYPDMIVCHMWDWSCWQSVRIFNGSYGLHYNNNAATSYFYPDASGKIQYEPITQATLDWLTEMNQWVNEGLVETVVNGEDKYGLPASGKVFSGFFAEVYDMCQPQLQETDPNAYFTFMPFPTGPNGAVPTIAGRLPYSNLTAVVDNGADQVKAALQFLDYAYFSDYGVYSEAAGVEGVDWTLQDGKFAWNKDILTQIELSKTPLQASGANIHFNGPSVNLFNVNMATDTLKKQIDSENGIVKKTPEQQDNWNKVSELNAKTSYALFPFMYMSDDDVAVLNDIIPDVQTYTDEMLEKFIRGTEPLSNFDSYVSQIKSLGIDQAIAVYQKAYDAYMAN